nr:hypothetical protein [Novosphingobium sp. THN1]
MDFMHGQHGADRSVLFRNQGMGAVTGRTLDRVQPFWPVKRGGIGMVREKAGDGRTVTGIA